MHSAQSNLCQHWRILAASPKARAALPSLLLARLLPLSYPRPVIVGMLHTLIKALELNELSLSWIFFLSFPFPSLLGWEQPPCALCRGWSEHRQDCG